MFKDIEIISRNDSNLFQKYWKNFLDNNTHSLNYTLEYIEYYNSYCKNIIQDLSFIFVKKNISVGICFLPIEKHEDTLSITLGGSYLLAPLCDSKVEKQIYQYIERIAIQHNVTHIQFAQDPNLEFNIPNQFNYLKKYNFIEMNSLNSTVDLTLSKESLWSNLSKSFKSLINKYTKTTSHTLHIMNKENCNWDTMNQFYLLHKKIAGQYARDIELFQAQYKLIQQGFGSLYYIKEDKQLLSCSLFFHYKAFVTYASSVSENLVEKPPLSHYTLWNAIVNFKQENYKLIQFSQPSGYGLSTGIDDLATAKELSIASFKRNMGAISSTLYRGSKYYDKALLEEKLLHFLDHWSHQSE
ncbi:MAG: hypothetical protein IE909_10040 [Campylobacterales bacterium]|nr:hypothetical protein [Campylobacterales bacterium]